RTLYIGGQSIALTPDKRSTPALAVQLPEGIWYGFLTPGTAPGRLTVRMPDNQVYSLIEPLVHGKFQVTLNNMPANSQFSLQISAAGNFEIDWGLGTAPQVINKTNTTLTTYTSPASPRYSGGPYTVTIRGRATSYNSGTIAAISFRNSLNQSRIVDIAGDLGSIFPILNASNTGSPRFFETFMNLIGLTGPIPSNLFAGVQGPPISHMFRSTFNGSAAITGEIPSNLFAGIQGRPAAGVFQATFNGCSGLTGSIPENLFAGIQGPPAATMFQGTFSGASGLTGSIPGNLFAGIQGRPTVSMFNTTFLDCSGLTGPVPGNLFAGIQGPPASEMFRGTFNGCTGLTGEIPGGLFAGIQGVPAIGMFQNTFNTTPGLTGIGTGLFDGISGAAQTDMFWGTFLNATGLRGPAAQFSNGQLLHQRWPSATTAQVGSAFRGATGLNNFNSIPVNWR
ncbi:MAG: hypothetical protein FWE64_03375, partial [Alphaproteobacteria bacterium]|nr:hypothetical protein [Alphaproteobacteria bacterium]